MDGAVVNLLRLLEPRVAPLEPPVLHPHLRVLAAALRQLAVQPLDPLHRLFSLALLALLRSVLRQGSQVAVLVLDALAEDLGAQGNQHFVREGAATHRLAAVLQVFGGAETRNALLVAVGEIQDEHGNVQLGRDQKHSLTSNLPSKATWNKASIFSSVSWIEIKNFK